MKMNDLACRLSLLNYAMILSEGGPVLRKTNIEFSSRYGVISLLLGLHVSGGLGKRKNFEFGQAQASTVCASSIINTTEHRSAFCQCPFRWIY